MCFGLSTGILAIGTYDRRFQQGEMLWTVQRENELGYTYDVYDMRIQKYDFCWLAGEDENLSWFVETDSCGNQNEW